MSKWKPWQQMAFLGYLLILNLIIFGTFGFLLFNTYRRNQAAHLSTDVAVAPTTAFAVFSTITPMSPIMPSVTPTPIPPLNIPPVLRDDEILMGTMTPVAIALVEGSRSQAWTATPTRTPTLTPLPTATSTLPPSSTPRPTATPTQTPRPTASATPTPLPTTTSTLPPSSTPRPTATPTQTPRPTASATPTPLPTATSTLTPSSTPQSTATPTLTVTRQPTLIATQAVGAKVIPTRTPNALTIQPTPPPSPTVTQTSRPTVTVTRTPTSIPKPVNTPSTQPSFKPTPQVVAAALKDLTANPPAEVSASRLAQPDLSLATTAGLVDAVPLTNASIGLSWTPVAKTAEYRIYSDMGSGYGVYIHKADVTEPAFVDKLLRPGLAYSYKVTRLEANREVVLAQTQADSVGDRPTAGPLLNQQPVVTATVAPAPTPLPPDAVLLGLLSDNSFTDDFNTVNIVGEVRNDSNLNVGQSDIAVTFYDANGAVVGTANGKTILEVIPPGEVAPFLITLSRPSGMVSYSVRAVARPVAPQLNAQLSIVEVKRYEDDTGFFHVKGVVANTGSVVVKRAKVAAVIYGRGGGVINVGFTYLSPPTLAPGQRASYEVIFTYFPKYVSQRVIPFEE